MPVRSYYRRKKKEQRSLRFERSTKSLSPPHKSKITRSSETNKNRSDILMELDDDTDSNQCSQSDHSYQNLLKQLHSDFNKKYISDKVTINSKLRWNRNFQESPSGTEDGSTPSNVIPLSIKQSPQIPSPLYSPIKARRKPRENRHQNTFPISLETPSSSNETESKIFKEKEQNLRTSNLILLPNEEIAEPVESNSPIKFSKKDIAASSPKSTISSLQSPDLLTKETPTKRNHSRKISKSIFKAKKKFSVSNKKNKLKKVTNIENVSQYFVEEEHYNMENILETESEKSDFPTTRSPTSVSLEVVRTPSPSTSITDEMQMEPTYFLKQIAFAQTEIKTNTNTIENERKLKKSKTTDYKANSEKRKDALLVPTRQILCPQDFGNNDYNNENSCSIELTVDNSGGSALTGIVDNKLSAIEENSSEKIFDESKFELENPLLFDKENNIDLQPDFTLVQNNETFHYPVLHNRISSLKSPMSMDSAQGSSIDVETNYHPKHCEIFWGRKGNFPYWPCLIWPDPEGKTVRIEKQSTRQCISYHVKFFADNGQRSWIYKDNLIAYNGREDFERRSKEQSSKMKGNMFKKYFVVSRAKLPIWDQAVKEADKILSIHIEKRPEKFDEILRESMELLKIHKQQRRLSMSIERSSSLFSNNSIIDSSEDLLNTSGISSALSTVSKRRRSSSLYENLAKRHKIELNSEEVIQEETLATINANSNKYLFPKELVEVMADYALKTTENEESFQRFENCCTELFHIVKDSTCEENNRGSNVKKHPNRILRKNLISKLKKQYIQILSKPPINVDKVKRKRATLDSPSIHIVLKDIIDLLEDKQYLFRHLKKGPVCNICLKSNDLFKCSGYCDSWIHKTCSNFTVEEYLEKIKMESKKKRGKKALTKNESFQHKEADEISSVHITGDDEENLLGKKKHEEADKSNKPESTVVELNFPEKFTCKQCLIQVEPFCFVCKLLDKEDDNSDWNNSDSNDILNNEKSPNQSKETLIKCKLSSCNKYYHPSCLKVWPQAYITKTKDPTSKLNSYVEKVDLLCPSHTCHTCVSDNPHHIQLGKNNIIKCVKCPATYHFYSKCVPAGTEFLTANIIICPRHNEKLKPTNTDWCFLCSGSGNLICCDTCPSSFHLSCLKLNQAPKDKYLCELCQNGCLPLYGDLVWCKFGQYKWWPSVIIPPPIIPKNLFNKIPPKFGFCVRFLGTNDYGWTGRHRVYLYQEDDYSFDRKKDKVLQRAIDEAKLAWDYFEKNKSNKGGIEDDSTPLPYKKIKNNLPVPPVKLEYNINESNQCICLPNDDFPCGYNSQCLNRAVLIECDPKICPAKLNCQNQMFEKRQYAPLNIRKTTGKGFGLICTAPISAGSFIIEYIGELIDDEELKRRIEEKLKEKNSHYYFFSIESNLTIDAGPKGNLARFMNHSCEPNCEPQMWTVNGVKRIGLFAKYDIKEESELTFHYNFECVGDNKISCHCGTENCKGFIGGIYNKKSNEIKNSSQEKDDTTSSKNMLTKAKQVQEK